MQVDYLKLEILTPIHIGIGDEIDPLGYLMQQEGEEVFCHFVDTTSWAAEYPDPEALSAVFSGSNIPAIRGFLAENLDPHSYARRTARVTNSSIYQEYNKKLRDQSTTHQLMISPQMATSLGRPHLPGSSIKGAIRTAVIDYLDRTRNLNLKAAAKTRDRRPYEEKIKSVLGGISANAFKQLKIGDFEGWSDSTVLVTATEVRRRADKATTPKCHAEALPSWHLGKKEHTVLVGKIVMGYGQVHDPKNNRLTLADGESWDWSELAHLVNTYQKKRLEKEIERFYNLPHFAAGKKAIESVKQALEEAEPGQMILRVGHYSQVEYVTVENNDPQTRKGKDGQLLPHGTTRTLANGELPFGWIRLTPCSAGDYAKNQQQRREHAESIDSRRSEKRKQVQLEKERIEKERRQREQEREEALKYPWRALLRQLDSVDNWGDFRQLVLDGPLSEHRNAENVAELVRQKALELSRGKWDEQRDSLVAQWLEEAGLKWESKTISEVEDPALSAEDEEMIKKIENLNDWGHFRTEQITIDKLDQPALLALRDKLQEWGCDNKKAKADKKKAWKQLQEALKR
jgi:CRISPR type III-A-associated RAMP protein Csm5